MEKPKWCNYPDTDKPIWGCWSLLSGKVTSEDYCKTCERYKKE
jgi:hypothetical protein